MYFIVAQFLKCIVTNWIPNGLVYIFDILVIWNGLVIKKMRFYKNIKLLIIVSKYSPSTAAFTDSLVLVSKQ